MQAIQSLLKPLIGPSCAQSLSLFEFSSNCVKLLVSKGLGVAVILGSSILKVPQIIKIVNAKSAAGLSMISYVLETAAYTIAISYNMHLDNPFSTYGEGVFIWVQNLVIMALLFSYSRQYVGVLASTLGFVAFAYMLLYGVSINTLLFLQWSSLFIGIASKVPQIITNMRSHSTGQLSIITTFLQTAARIFTTMQEVKDVSILTGYIVSFLLNALLLSQFFLFPASKKASKQTKKRQL